MKSIFRAKNLCALIPVVILLSLFAGMHALQEEGGLIPLLKLRLAGKSSSSQPETVASGETLNTYRHDRSDLSGITWDEWDNEDWMPQATLSPSMRTLEQAIGQMRDARQRMANGAAIDDGTMLSAAAEDYRNALTQAQEIFELVRLRSDEHAEFTPAWHDQAGKAFIGKHGEIIFRADELRLLVNQ